MAITNNTPSIRFAGFTDAWERRELKAYAEFNPKSDLPDEFEYVDLESVVGTTMVAHRRETKLSAPSRAQRLAKNGDIFYQTVRPYQKNNFLFELQENNYVFSTGYAQLRPHIFPKYLMTLLQTDDFVKEVLNNCTGSSYPAINSNDLSEIKVTVTTDDTEQHLIGTFFSKIDNLITLHQRERSIDVNSDLFHRRPTTTAWERRELGAYGNFYYGKSAPKWSVRDDAPTPCIRYGELYTKFGTKIEEVFSYTTIPHDKLVFSKGTEVLIPRVGEDPWDYNHCTWLSLKGIAIGEMISVYDTKQNPLFTATMFNATLQKEFAIRVEGGSVTNLYYDKLKNILVSFPSLTEQEKIASLFSNLDDLITLHQRE